MNRWEIYSMLKTDRLPDNIKNQLAVTDKEEIIEGIIEYIMTKNK